MWLLTQKRIQCRTVLLKKKVVQSSACEICGEADETPEHIMCGCNLAKELWQHLNMPSMLAVDMDSIHTITPRGGIPHDKFPTFLALVCWHLWKARNVMVFRNELQSLSQVLAACKHAAEQWRYRFSRKKKHLADAWCQIFTMARQGPFWTLGRALIVLGTQISNRIQA